MSTVVKIKGKKSFTVRYDDLGRLKSITLPVVAEESFKSFVKDFVPFTFGEVESYATKYKGRVSYTLVENDVSQFGRWKAIWVQNYERLKGFEPKFDKTDAKKLNEIFDFIRSKTAEDTEAELIFRGLLNLLGKEVYPKWIEEGLSLSTFSARLNIIIDCAMRNNNEKGGSLFSQYNL